MTNETNPSTVEATPADREAAFALDNAMSGGFLKGYERAAYLNGERDDWHNVQHLARHRLAAQSQPAATVQEVGQDVTKDVLASLVAALSILNRAHAEHKEPRKVVSSDAMFAQMLKDYEASVVRARAALTAESAAKAGDVAEVYKRGIYDAKCWLRDQQHKNPPDSLWHAAAILADRMDVALLGNSPSPQPDMGSGEAVALSDILTKHDRTARYQHLGEGNRHCTCDAVEVLITDIKAALSPPASQSVEKEGWQPIETAPRDGTPFIAALMVRHSKAGTSWQETHVVWCDDETGEIDSDCEQGWSRVDDYEAWMPILDLPAALPHKEEATPATTTAKDQA